METIHYSMLTQLNLTEHYLKRYYTSLCS